MGNDTIDRAALIRAAFAAREFAYSAGAREFAAIAVVGARDNGPDDALITSPCGVCRQMLYEFGGDSLLVIMAKSETDWVERTLGELLPLGFGPAKLQ